MVFKFWASLAILSLTCSSNFIIDNVEGRQFPAAGVNDNERFFLPRPFPSIPISPPLIPRVPLPPVVIPGVPPLPRLPPLPFPIPRPPIGVTIPPLLPSTTTPNIAVSVALICNWCFVGHCICKLQVYILFSKKPFLVFLESSGYSQEDVLLQKAKAGIQNASFDKDSKYFLLLIRGTHSIKDTLTAASGVVVPFLSFILHDDGISNLVLVFAYCGMVVAARWIAQLNTPFFLKALDNYPDYKVKGQGYGEFNDIRSITIMVDYIVPAVLQQLGVLKYSSKLAKLIVANNEIDSGSEEEVKLWTCSIYAVERMKELINKKLGKQVLLNSFDISSNLVLVYFLLVFQ
ncbi:hypothetical protein FEM48_Zijuj02G0196100 [Ziziphus jujuba var. spinosa]|uniref:Uncharacterized protein n=1 Tax=Ziziphus jujuba var. spinosa TaxID=714518 RepID=A0A978VXK7_ZIZJJ|nr:hypothetical protein FEM48_Zijuj02G0196100 [Ziziphus jujuba var. spinosa]